MSAKVRGIPFGFEFRKGDLWADTGIKIFQIEEMERFKEWKRENFKEWKRVAREKGSYGRLWTLRLKSKGRYNGGF